VSTKKFQAINFGCRVNAAETNQLSQQLIDQGYQPSTDNPDIIIVNTCAITKKGEKESINTIISLSKKFPHAEIRVTGCASDKKIKNISNITYFSNQEKQKILPSKPYSPKIKDKFSHTHRYLLRIQTGCTQFCSFCIVPFRRPDLWSLSINDAINEVKEALLKGYHEVIITGVNLDQYEPGFSHLIEALLTETSIPLISFGSIPVNCLDDKFATLLTEYPSRWSSHLHIPIQSGSNKILKLMNRPYTREQIIKTISNYKLKIKNLTFGADLIVGFPTETEQDFQETVDLCQKIGLSKAHVFPYSPRSGTKGRIIFENSQKISNLVKKQRSQQIRNLIAQTTLPSHQTPDT